MALTERQMVILETIRQTGQVEVLDLSSHFDVTEQTIRRDLSFICDQGLALRTHGGARRSVAVSVSNMGHEERRNTRSFGKGQIAELAVTLIPNNCSVSINIGTTTERVAQALSRHEGLVVLTNNINIVGALSGLCMKEIILAGGTVRESDGAIVGAQAVKFIERYKVDFAIIGASALDEDGAVLDFDDREVSVARAIMRNARTSILVADTSKFTRTAPSRICSVAELDYVITDKNPPVRFLENAEAGNTVVMTAESSGNFHEQT